MDVTICLNDTRSYQKPLICCQSHTQLAKNWNILSKTYQNLQNLSDAAKDYQWMQKSCQKLPKVYKKLSKAWNIIPNNLRSYQNPMIFAKPSKKISKSSQNFPKISEAALIFSKAVLIIHFSVLKKSFRTWKILSTSK